MAEEPTNNAIPDKERIGKYEIIRHVATGGMGAVYKARDVELDRLVALKILPPEMAKDEKIILRFRQEAKAAAQLRHENIVAIFDADEHEGTYFIAMEFIDGVDLQAYITRKSRLDPEDARQIMIQATRALAHAHKQGIVHRDVKPSNFLLTIKDKHVQVKLTDFGLALRNEHNEQFRITRDGTTVGTVDYMSPEQARNSQSVDIRSDIYSLGCTFFHMLGGIAPFGRGSLPERIIQHMQKAPPDVRRLNKVVPESVVAIINRMLAKKPEDRYQTPAELLQALTTHPKIISTGKRAPSPRSAERSAEAKPERGTDRPESIDPTMVMDLAEPKPNKPTRPKKTVDEPGAAKAAEEKRPRLEPKKTRPVKEEVEDEPEADIDLDDEDDEDDKAEDEESDTAEHALDPFENGLSRKDKSNPPHKGLPMWVYVAGGAAGVFVLMLVLVFAFSGRPPQKKKEDPLKTDSNLVVIVPPKTIDAPPVDKIDTAPTLMSAGPLPYAMMDKQFGAVDRVALRKEFHLSFTAFPEAPPNAKTLQWRRLATGAPNSCRTLADALEQAAANEWTVIEIHDDGPLYVPSLPALTQRNIVLRGAAGYRPLLAWDMRGSSGKEKIKPTFFPFSQGILVLDNLDLVVKSTEDQPATFFQMQAADFYARECTFSFFGKTNQSITLVKHQELKGVGKESRSTQTWLQRCYLRGPEATLLRTTRTSATLFLQESLVAGQNQPLLQLNETDEDTFHFHCVRSTLVTGQVLLRQKAIDGKKSSPRLRAWVLDSLLSRDEPNSASGDMIQLADGAEPSKMQWKAANSVYAGWKKLLAGNAESIGGDDLESWRRRWNYRQGDRAILESWPSHPVSRLAEAPANSFLPTSPSSVVYQASSGPGAIGCVIGWLPRAPLSWEERVYDPAPPPILGAGDGEPPAISTAADGLYHGEKLDLNKIEDLGAYLNNMLLKVTPAPRVVLHLTGKGTRPTSSLRITGVKNLVLFFEPAKEPKDALKLGVNPGSIAKQAPLIEMIDGHLELIGARIVLSPITLVPMMIRVQDGDLSLTRCWLQGPLVKSPEAFATLISVANGAAPLAAVSMRDNVILSGKSLLHFQGPVRLLARNNLFLSLGDGMRCNANGPASAIVHVLDHNTWAVRQTTFALPLGPGFRPDAPMRICANSDAFLNPFAEEAGAATLVRAAAPAVARDRFVWQGRYNVYDARLFSYFDVLDKSARDRQTLKDWQQVWGTVGETEAALYEAGPPRKTISIEGGAPDDLLSKLDRLALPKQLRGDPAQPPPGANLFSLRIITKKG